MPVLQIEYVIGDPGNDYWVLKLLVPTLKLAYSHFAVTGQEKEMLDEITLIMDRLMHPAYTDYLDLPDDIYDEPPTESNAPMGRMVTEEYPDEKV